MPQAREAKGASQLVEGPTHWGLALEAPWYTHPLGTGHALGMHLLGSWLVRGLPMDLARLW